MLRWRVRTSSPLVGAPAAAWTPTMHGGLDRRSMLKIPAGVALGVGLPALRPKDANAVVYFDPAMYVRRAPRPFPSTCDGQRPGAVGVRGGGLAMPPARGGGRRRGLPRASR